MGWFRSTTIVSKILGFQEIKYFDSFSKTTTYIFSLLSLCRIYPFTDSYSKILGVVQGFMHVLCKYTAKKNIVPYYEEEEEVVGMSVKILI